MALLKMALLKMDTAGVHGGADGLEKIIFLKAIRAQIGESEQMNRCLKTKNGVIKNGHATQCPFLITPIFVPLGYFR